VQSTVRRDRIALGHDRHCVRDVVEPGSFDVLVVQSPLIESLGFVIFLCPPWIEEKYVLIIGDAVNMGDKLNRVERP
jgi:hypothetical protein